MAKQGAGIKSVKELGWSYLDVSTKGFKGAIQGYTTAFDTHVAVCFNMHEAFVVEDEAGLFTQQDLEFGVIKAKNIDVTVVAAIEGATVLAIESGGEVQFNPLKLECLGLDNFFVKESIKNRLLKLAKLDDFVDVPI